MLQNAQPLRYQVLAEALREDVSASLMEEALRAQIAVHQLQIAALERALQGYLMQATVTSHDQSALSKQESSSHAQDLISAKEAAKLLGVCHKTITIYQQKGILPGVKVGRLYKFSRSALEKLLPRA